MSESLSCPLVDIVKELGIELLFPSKDYLSVKITSGDVHRPGLQLAGFFDYFDPTRLQLIGMMELSYLESFTAEERRAKLEALFTQKIPAVIACHGIALPEEIFEIADKYDVTILATELNTSDVASNIIRVAKRMLSPSVTRHGVLVEVYGMGLLILGESGVGKSETAIELLKRGHRLIADDAVEIKVSDVNQVQGTSPELIRHYMELRGIGIIDVRQIFGIGSVKMRQTIHLVVNLEQWKDGFNYDRLGVNETKEQLLGVDVASLTIPVRPGRNLAVILEVAAMNQRLKLMGHNAALEFTNQINSHFDSKLK
ncbi:MAG: HPr(Ser) kinase/phosphatase [Oscillospiraceae bacterium]|jgi:HPr kinase/phosphorylase|nr:HPr(Ser) kinase/phosphatase [Oscillospiraceae bacterium]